MLILAIPKKCYACGDEIGSYSKCQSEFITPITIRVYRVNDEHNDKENNDRQAFHSNRQIVAHAHRRVKLLCAVLFQQFGSTPMLFMFRINQRSQSVNVPRINICPCLDKDRNDFGFSERCCQVKRSYG